MKRRKLVHERFSCACRPEYASIFWFRQDGMEHRELARSEGRVCKVLLQCIFHFIFELGWNFGKFISQEQCLFLIFGKTIVSWTCRIIFWCFESFCWRRTSVRRLIIVGVRVLPLKRTKAIKSTQFSSACLPNPFWMENCCGVGSRRGLGGRPKIFHKSFSINFQLITAISFFKQQWRNKGPTCHLPYFHYALIASMWLRWYLLFRVHRGQKDNVRWVSSAGSAAFLLINE